MKWSNLSKKQKAYIGAFGALVSVMIWAFVSASLITHDFNRNQIAGNKDSKEAFINGIVLTETKEQQKYWELYAETGSYNTVKYVRK